MAAYSSSHLLKLALPLIKTHGFTREALARSVVSLPSTSNAQPHSEPLSDSAITALFGKGDAARRTLIDAWLNDGLRHMASASAKHRKGGEGGSTPARTIRDVLRARLKYNEPVLPHIPDAFALMASSGFHVVDPLPTIKHTLKIGDEACVVTGDKSLQLEWYARCASLAAVYAAADAYATSHSTHAKFLLLNSTNSPLHIPPTPSSTLYSKPRLTPNLHSMKLACIQITSSEAGRELLRAWEYCLYRAEIANTILSTPEGAPSEIREHRRRSAYIKSTTTLCEAPSVTTASAAGAVFDAAGGVVIAGSRPRQLLQPPISTAFKPAKPSDLPCDTIRKGIAADDDIKDGARLCHARLSLSPRQLSETTQGRIYAPFHQRALRDKGRSSVRAARTPSDVSDTLVHEQRTDLPCVWLEHDVRANRMALGGWRPRQPKMMMAESHRCHSPRPRLNSSIVNSSIAGASDADGMGRTRRAPNGARARIRQAKKWMASACTAARTVYHPLTPSPTHFRLSRRLQAYRPPDPRSPSFWVAAWPAGRRAEISSALPAAQIPWDIPDTVMHELRADRREGWQNEARVN
ncbi:hypothetical protein BJ912DRAFT_1083821 [Pholiota molesta]|nr:hypothetical protein BJ912DRAFT_1083821 [Pholiota molesta]